ncbi:BnaC01g37920D [Brassica napus]|uniref:BnaC01g37920D protein n=1 Tax=Brassica napus TaxID=3708 RepID=A0A078GGD2_BRANA|nr:BnaC01g37920D [Brassica napus]
MGVDARYSNNQVGLFTGPNAYVLKLNGGFSLLSLFPSSSSTHGSVGFGSSVPSSLFTNKIFAAPETLDEPSSEEFSEVPSSSSRSVDADKMAPKQKIRIKLKIILGASY